MDKSVRCLKFSVVATSQNDTEFFLIVMFDTKYVRV